MRSSVSNFSFWLATTRGILNRSRGFGGWCSSPAAAGPKGSPASSRIGKFIIVWAFHLNNLRWERLMSDYFSGSLDGTDDAVAGRLTHKGFCALSFVSRPTVNFSTKPVVRPTEIVTKYLAFPPQVTFTIFPKAVNFPRRARSTYLDDRRDGDDEAAAADRSRRPLLLLRPREEEAAASALEDCGRHDRRRRGPGGERPRPGVPRPGGGLRPRRPPRPGPCDCDPCGATAPEVGDGSSLQRRGAASVTYKLSGELSRSGI